jgi:hypothetical protein
MRNCAENQQYSAICVLMRLVARKLLTAGHNE